MRLRHAIEESSLPLALLRKQPDEPDIPSDGQPEEEEYPLSESSEDRRNLVCKACRTKITSNDLRVSIGGQHKHVFFNPHGFVFEIGCFSDARNVVVTGPRTDEFTWFAGYAWQLATCGSCGGQLGWRYTGNGGFFGFILTQLVEEEESDR